MLWDDFLNSDYHDWRGSGRSEDRLEITGWLAKWLEEHNLPDPGTPSEEDMAGLKRLRARMLRTVQDLAIGLPVHSDDVEELNRVLAGGPFVHRIVPTQDGLRLDTSSLRQEWPGIQAEIAASFSRMLSEGEPSRICICDNPDCLWVYYDETRNRSKRYCDDKMCGNLMKVRRFRARKKNAALAVAPDNSSFHDE